MTRHTKTSPLVDSPQVKVGAKTKKLARDIAARDALRRDLLEAEARKLIPGDGQPERDRRRTVVKTAFDTNLSIQDVLHGKATKKFARRMEIEGARAKETKNMALLSIPMKDLRQQLEAVRKLVATEAQQGRNAFAVRRRLEEIERAWSERKSGRRYIRLTQGGAPGLGKHRS